jgi:hypothetical protein
MDKYKEVAIAHGWIDCFVNEGKLWGYRDRHAVIPERVELLPEAFDDIPLAEMYLLFRDR